MYRNEFVSLLDNFNKLITSKDHRAVNEIWYETQPESHRQMLHDFFKNHPINLTIDLPDGSSTFETKLIRPEKQREVVVKLLHTNCVEIAKEIFCDATQFWLYFYGKRAYFPFSNPTTQSEAMYWLQIDDGRLVEHFEAILRAQAKQPRVSSGLFRSIWNENDRLHFLIRKMSDTQQFKIVRMAINSFRYIRKQEACELMQAFSQCFQTDKAFREVEIEDQRLQSRSPNDTEDKKRLRKTKSELLQIGLATVQRNFQESTPQANMNLNHSQALNVKTSPNKQSNDPGEAIQNLIVQIKAHLRALENWSDPDAIISINRHLEAIQCMIEDIHDSTDKNSVDTMDDHKIQKSQKSQTSSDMHLCENNSLLLEGSLLSGHRNSLFHPESVDDVDMDWLMEEMGPELNHSEDCFNLMTPDA